MSYAVEACERAAIECLSLMDAMRTGGEAYFLLAGDDHWNDAGQAAAAGAIAAYLKDNDFLPLD